jgi:oxaloacetate decarboxylase alpha subunit
MPGLDELRRRLPAGIDDEELVLLAVMPPDQVDAMQAAGPARLRYYPDAKPLLALLRAVASRSDLFYLSVQKPGFGLVFAK